MKRTVFYSWQSDSPSALNRNLIEEALKRAIRVVHRDEAERVEPVLDRDTSGLPGSPSISDSIFAKIAQADAFVADVTIINPRARRRRTPNPNVLIELGYAISTLGWDRILLVQNTAFGSPDRLPFDLRGRRVVTYNLPTGASTRAEIRGLLQGRLEAELRRSLRDSMFKGAHAGREIPIWWGNWHYGHAGHTVGGHLFIRESSPAGFLFDISVISGAHAGQLDGFARIVSPDLAYARIQAVADEDVCEISFRRSISGHRRVIEVEEKSGCGRYHGAGATFSGVFEREHDGLFDSGALDEMDLQRLYSITGQYYRELVNCFQMVGEGDNFEQRPARVVVGAPRGLFTIMEGIVVRGRFGELWAAYIDGDEVRYFTTERSNRDKLPLTIERWRDRFPQKTIVFVADVDRIAKRDF